LPLKVFEIWLNELYLLAPSDASRPTILFFLFLTHFKLRFAQPFLAKF